jgi:hypothetical protein
MAVEALRALVSPFALFYYYEFDYWMFELVGSACSENNRSTLGYYSCAFALFLCALGHYLLILFNRSCTHQLSIGHVL